MELTINNVRPQYIADTGHSEIWGRTLSMMSPHHLHVIAPSGSGKTSFIHFVYGVRTDYSGTILIDGKDISKMGFEEKALLRQKRISIIFQDLKLLPGQTALENIEIKRKLSPFHDRDTITRMATQLGIADKLSQKTVTCSYGEQQRIAIIRALMQPFELLLLDEPFSHLDEDNRMKAMELIYEECEKRKAMMLLADLKKLSFLESEKSLRL